MLVTATLPDMGKRKNPRRGRPKNPVSSGESRLFIEMDAGIKDALAALAKREGRTLKAQLTRILEEVLSREGVYRRPAD